MPLLKKNTNDHDNNNYCELIYKPIDINLKFNNVENLATDHDVQDMDLQKRVETPCRVFAVGCVIIVGIVTIFFNNLFTEYQLQAKVLTPTPISPSANIDVVDLPLKHQPPTKQPTTTQNSSPSYKKTSTQIPVANIISTANYNHNHHDHVTQTFPSEECDTLYKQYFTDHNFTSNSNNIYIPKDVYQTWVIHYEHEAIKNMKLLNSGINGYTFHLYNNTEMDMFMLNDIGSQWDELAQSYFCIDPRMGAARADIWRYAVLWKKGGVYVDYDTECLYPFDSMLLRNENDINHVYYNGYKFNVKNKNMYNDRNMYSLFSLGRYDLFDGCINQFKYHKPKATKEKSNIGNIDNNGNNKTGIETMSRNIKADVDILRCLSEEVGFKKPPKVDRSKFNRDLAIANWILIFPAKHPFLTRTLELIIDDIKQLIQKPKSTYLKPGVPYDPQYRWSVDRVTGPYKIAQGVHDILYQFESKCDKRIHIAANMTDKPDMHDMCLFKSRSISEKSLHQMINFTAWQSVSGFSWVNRDDHRCQLWKTT